MFYSLLYSIRRNNRGFYFFLVLKINVLVFVFINENIIPQACDDDKI